ncbi:unnamed protein product [Penicillium egyptiacum]|uniref:Uncharacterized protein n=1 Tax=Penicillium egyptiacum TaxID=1303716 RepID=A0A9W4KBK3_9EURO|nr:unnamed protein product [Penicillium egyptiacum]
MYSLYSPGTPCIGVSLEGPSAISETERLCITVKITYDGLTNEDCEAVHADAKPITIHDYPFYRDNFRLQRRCHDYDPLKNSDEDPLQWKGYFDDERNEGWMIVDEPDVEVNVTDSIFFRSLQPGESLIRHVFLGFLDLHPNTVVGDTYRYQYWGCCWTWGDREDHAKTVVKLPCWLNDHVVDPADNDGRPVITHPILSSSPLLIDLKWILFGLDVKSRNKIDMHLTYAFAFSFDSSGKPPCSRWAVSIYKTASLKAPTLMYSRVCMDYQRVA